MSSLFNFRFTPKIDISFTNEESMEKKKVRIHEGKDNKQISYVERVVFNGEDPVSGTVTISGPSGKKIEYTGIRVEVITIY